MREEHRNRPSRMRPVARVPKVLTADIASVPVPPAVASAPAIRYSPHPVAEGTTWPARKISPRQSRGCGWWKAISPRSTSTRSSTPRTAACWAAAGWTARSTVRPGPSCRRVRRDSAAARPARRGSRTGIRLKARHVIHAVGPVWNGGGRARTELLASCYRRASRSRRSTVCIDRLPRDLDRHLRLPARPRRPDRGAHLRGRAGGAPQDRRGHLLLLQPCLCPAASGSDRRAGTRLNARYYGSNSQDPSVRLPVIRPRWHPGMPRLSRTGPSVRGRNPVPDALPASTAPDAAPSRTRPCSGPADRPTHQVTPDDKPARRPAPCLGFGDDDGLPGCPRSSRFSRSYSPRNFLNAIS